jgi:hypothetical protein
MVLPLRRIFNKNAGLLMPAILTTLAAFSFIMPSIIEGKLGWGWIDVIVTGLWASLRTPLLKAISLCLMSA